jgi:hypothetical protein
MMGRQKPSDFKAPPSDFHGCIDPFCGSDRSLPPGHQPNRLK